MPFSCHPVILCLCVLDSCKKLDVHLEVCLTVLAPHLLLLVWSITGYLFIDSRLSLSRISDFCMLKDIERERKIRDNPDSIDENIDDEMSEIKLAHFEESMKFAHRSVSDVDILKYGAFAQTLQQSRGFGTEFLFADSEARISGSDPFAASSGGADEDDLYS
ncbi:unnamed protein product [Fraxinus pennsylvanica]|uniref:Transitional endoplasmic reticulum ATPase n=1 Tax=Fraxinus pennsylvanica TaxID=56036 RepID=A0AAD2DX33_9LAMI|nr:unnamed protein product [Fraxinus pennsylvanica]